MQIRGRHRIDNTVATFTRSSQNIGPGMPLFIYIDSGQMKKFTISIKPIYHAPEVEVIMTLN